MRRTGDFGIKFLVFYFILVGLSLTGFWAIQLSSGFLDLGASTIKSDSVILWHVIAEILTGLITLISAFLMLGRHPLGLRLGLFACGLLLYTGLNSIGWAILHDPGLLTLYIIITFGAIFGFLNLIGRDEL